MCDLNLLHQLVIASLKHPILCVLFATKASTACGNRTFDVEYERAEYTPAHIAVTLDADL